jgi:hypothetical protein
MRVCLARTADAITVGHSQAGVKGCDPRCNGSRFMRRCRHPSVAARAFTIGGTFHRSKGTREMPVEITICHT